MEVSPCCSAPARGAADGQPKLQSTLVPLSYFFVERKDAPHLAGEVPAGV